MTTSITTATHVAVLEDRGVVSVSGADAAKLLGGLITNEIGLFDRTPAMFAGLLSPQGKILFDFLVVRTAGGFLLETARGKTAELGKRLTLYKLRADVEIRDVSEQFRVAAIWGGGEEPIPAADGVIVYPDPRLSELGFRALARVDAALQAMSSAGAYHAHRIGLGVPEGGKDYMLGDTFPHEALFDQLNGVSFSKGCFVGQEVVSRMQHRGTARKRIVPVVAAEALPTEPQPVFAGGAEIGRLGSVSGSRGLALLRLDRVAEATRDGVPISVGGLSLQVELPAFATFTLGVPHEIA